MNRFRFAIRTPLPALLALASATASADTYSVGGDAIGRFCDFLSLQAAVDAAAAHPGADVLRVSRDLAAGAQQAVVDDADTLDIDGGYEDCLDEVGDHRTTRLQATGTSAAIRKLGTGSLRLRWLELVGSDVIVRLEAGVLDIDSSEVHGSGSVGIGAAPGTELLVRASSVHDNLYGINPQGGVLWLTGSEVHDNAAIGVIAYAGSTLRIDGSSVHGNGTDPLQGQGGIWMNPGEGRILVSDSAIFGNQSLQSGGGIHIQGGDPDHPALLAIGGHVAIHDNRSDHAGGGIYALDTRLDMGDAPGSRIANNHSGTIGGGIAIFGGSADIGSGDPDGTIAGNHAVLQGGGLLAADSARVRLYTTDPAAPLRIRGNSTGTVDSLGGGIALLQGAAGAATAVYAMDVSIEGNTAAIGGGVGVHAPDAIPGSRAVFCLQGEFTAEPWCDGMEIPQGSGCADPGLCTRLVDNVSEGSYEGRPNLGAAIALHGPGASLHADHARIERNDGGSTIAQLMDGLPDAPGELAIVNALVAGNRADEALIVKQGEGALGILCSTIAANAIKGPATIAADSGVYLVESIVSQPGTQTYSGTPATIDARFVLSHEVGTLAPEASVFAGDPHFVDAAAGDFHLLDDSPALDVSGVEFEACDNDLEGSARGVDLPGVDDLFGPRDLGAFERAFVSDSIFRDGFEVAP